jgi:hypothetical protein
MAARGPVRALGRPLKKLFAVEVLACFECGGRAQLIALIEATIVQLVTAGGAAG